MIVSKVRRGAACLGMLFFIPSTGMSAAYPKQARSFAQPGDYVILLHGLGRTAFSMKLIEWSLKEKGFRVINASCPSTRLSIEEIADTWLARLIRERAPDKSVKIHFVTHSLGGIILRQYLNDHPLANLGRVVMLAPPNQGSEVADVLKHKCLFKLCTGRAGQQLGTDPSSVPRRLGPATFELGIIAGDRSANPLLSSRVPKPNDGKVSVISTRLAGMQDFVVLHHTHTWLPCSQDAIRAAVQFLQTGRFVGSPLG